MNAMRAAATGAALLTLAVTTACGTSSQPTQSSSAPTPTPTTASAAASPSPTASSPPASVRPGFAASDVSFVSTQRGWVLGSGQLLTTDDGAVSWTALPPPPAGVTHLRFATSADGYAWSTDGALWLTTDGGASWQPGRLGQVLSLETASGLVWAIAGEQPYPDVWRAAVGSTAWAKLGLTPDRSATLLVHGPTAYVVGQEGAGPIAPSVEVYTGTQAGRHQSVPCPASLPVPNVALGASTDGSLVLVCDVQGQSAETDLAYASTDGGASWTAITAPPVWSNGVTAITGKRFSWNGNVLVSSGGAWTVALAESPGGFSLVGFETDQQGVALATDGALWITRDGGSTWSRVTFAG
ncbi:MAG: hypothetical protein ACRDOU_21340 [Streptosporangiaceae bacterium]